MAKKLDVPVLTVYDDNGNEYDIPAFKSGSFPKGGTKGQVLKKKSEKDYDTEWQDDTGVQSDWNQENPDEPDYVKNKILPESNASIIDDLLSFDLITGVEDSNGILCDENDNIILW